MVAVFHRLLALTMLSFATALTAPTAGHAYRVFLDHNSDGDLYTFENEVVGPMTAPITYVIQLGAEDVGLTGISFSIHWDCEFLGGDCPTPHGDILHDSLHPPDQFPFFGTEIFLCLAWDCNCFAGRSYFTSVVAPLEGNWALVTEDFTRIGNDPICNPRDYDEVEFQISCPECTYLPGDETKTRMVLRSGPVSVGSNSWGRVKSIYR